MIFKVYYENSSGNQVTAGYFDDNKEDIKWMNWTLIAFLLMQ